MSLFKQTCQALADATTEGEVVLAVQRFIGAMAEADRAQLPWGLRAGGVSNAGHVALWALEFSKSRAIDDEQVGPAYGQTVRVFKTASERLVELRRA